MITDLFLVYSFLKKLTTPFKEWSAFKLGIIDENGNILISRKDFTKNEQRDAFGLFDNIVLKLRKILMNVPGGQSKIATYAAALWLIKEHKNFTEDTLTEGVILNGFLDYSTLVEDAGVATGVPANNGGSGQVAGIGVGPNGEPGDKKKRKKETNQR